MVAPGGALGNDWIATEYANVHDRAAFMTLGAEEVNQVAGTRTST